jgi:hypothetical protein
MDRTLDDIEGGYVIVPPGEGISLAEIDKLAYPTMGYATGQERPAALFVVRPLRHDDPEGLGGSGRYDGGISFDDLLRTINPKANPNVWTNADSAPYWHMGVSSPSRTDRSGDARVFAPTLPGAPPAERPVTRRTKVYSDRHPSQGRGVRSREAAHSQYLRDYRRRRCRAGSRGIGVGDESQPAMTWGPNGSPYFSKWRSQ